MNGGVIYADSESKVTAVVDACNRAFDRGEAIGFDTEFYNVDVGRESCVARSRLHMFSIAVRRWPRATHPRGFFIADTAVFLRGDLRNAGLTAILEGKGQKAVHNLPVDAHTLKNEGITLGGGINTLARARFAWPGRARGPGFTLDSLGTDFCGVGKTESFRELFSEEYDDPRITSRKARSCECGAVPCRARSSTPGHARIETIIQTVTPRLRTRPVPLEVVVPGHTLWPRALAYSAQDAWLALAILDLSSHEMNRQIEMPW